MLKLNTSGNGSSVVVISGQVLSILTIGISFYTTINFSIFWTYHLLPGANYFALLIVNIIICLLLVTIPIIFLIHPRKMLSKTYLIISIFLFNFFTAGFLYLFDMFLNSTSSFVISFLLNLILIVPTIIQSRYLDETKHPQNIGDA